MHLTQITKMFIKWNTYTKTAQKLHLLSKPEMNKNHYISCITQQYIIKHSSALEIPLSRIYDITTNDTLLWIICS